MSASVNEVRVEEDFVKASFAGLDLIISEQIGFINASHLCTLEGKKLARYNEPQARKKLKLALNNYYRDPINKVNPNANHDPSVSGTYFHPALFLDLAFWLSPETYVRSAVIINSFFNESDRRKWLLRNLFACEEVEEVDASEIDLPNRLQYEILGLPVAINNEYVWFRASDFCGENGRKLRDFEARKDVASLLEYFRTRGLFHGTLYHPLLFLRLAGWVNMDFYVEYARLVFCGSGVQLNLLFRKQIVAAGASYSVGTAVPSNQPTTNGNVAASASNNVRSAGPSNRSTTNGIGAVSVANNLGSAVQSNRSITNGNVAASASNHVRSAVPSSRLTTNGNAAVGPSNSVRSAVPSNRSTTNRNAAASASSGVGSAVASNRSATNGNAAASASSNVRSAVTADRSMTNGGGPPVKLGEPSTSSGQAALPRPDLSNVIWLEEDDVSEDSQMTLDMCSEVDDTLTRKEHEVEMARVRRELESAVERERMEKEEALAREREKEAALARVEREKRAALERERAKDDQIEALTRQLEDMEIGDSRMTLRKRSHAETRANAAATLMKEVGIERLECLVLFMNTKNAVYGFRRQFQNIVPAIHQQLDKVAMFVGWFVTNNAVLDYNRCKALVSKKAEKCERNVRITQNQMELDDEDGAEFDLADTIRTTLRIDLEVIEADVKILGRLFKRRTYHDGDAISADSQRGAASSTFLARVHAWIENEHASFMSLLERRQQRRNQTARR